MVYGACGSDRERHIERTEAEEETSLYESETECCVLQVADIAGAEPVANLSLIYEQLCQYVP